MFPIYAQNFSELFNSEQIYVFIALAVMNTFLLFFSSLKFLLVIQQCGYKEKRCFKWLTNKDTPYMSRLMLLCLLGFLFFCVMNTCFEPLLDYTMASYVGFVAYILFMILYINSESSVNAKVPLKKTKRLVRLCITYCLLLFVFSFALLVGLNCLAFVIGDEVVALLRFSLICAMPILVPYILYLANGLNAPIETIIKRHYVKITTEKLDRADVIKIAITGSYAKTTTKEILKTLLSQRYRVLATDGSYNTPMGIALTAKNLDSTHDVFIAEMGARHVGDIKELVNIVKPKYGVLTGINNQHLETFGSIDNIIKTKNELFTNMVDGVGFFGSDNDIAINLYQEFAGEKYLAGISSENALCYATDIQLSPQGMSFTLNIVGEEPITCSTVLLGRHNVKNICLASSVAYKLGLTPNEIALGINRLKSIGHRLELTPNNKNIIIIDDSYNGNEDGVNAAMEVLDAFSGRKIVLTPGLVELGKMENIANLEFGKRLAKHADIVIVIGKHNAEMLINGLIDGGMSRDNIKFARTLNKGNALLNEIIVAGDVVLFENDLPDNYN